MIRSIALAFAILGTIAGAGVAAPSESEQRMACMADALRLCASKIPDHDAIAHCLGGKHDQLSPGCAVVFDASTSPRKAHAR